MDTKRSEVLDRLARGRDKWFVSVEEVLPRWLGFVAFLEPLLPGEAIKVVIPGAVGEEYIYESSWRKRRIELGLEKRPEPVVTPEEDDAWNEKRMDAIGINGGEALHYGMTPVEAVEWSGQDTGAHYRYSYRAKVTQADADRGHVDVKLDPYRICEIYQVGGGPREHIVKKGLRGLRKGDTERGLIKQLRDALDRWEEMLDEDEGK
jgi:hypothetical protein